MENITDSDIFINAYLKKQEDFTVEVIRKKLEGEVKIQLLQTELQKVLEEKNAANALVKQSLSGLEGITLERDKYKTKVSELETKLEKDTRALREININNQTLIDDLKVQVKSYSTLKSDYETLKNNYDMVRAELNKVSEKPVTKKKSKKEQESEWIDGNEISA